MIKIEGMDTSKQPRHFKCIKRDIKKLSKNLLIQVIHDI